ncbi:hypothetical protein Anas_09638 [Armadillidium nasatum]|uniref:Uncharacterized protein n=1 Tax=Armadillidium nasatum TaxID=96803 RepID=A0A5N5SYB2_9CRUS|nr:hypothetical protein Anas_09638 [Armadillidium nasatum]
MNDKLKYFMIKNYKIQSVTLTSNMSNGYTQPYESLNSTAKIIRIPGQHTRSKSVDRNFWNRVFSMGQLSPNTTNPNRGKPKKRKDSTPGINQKPQDNNAVIIVNDNGLPPKPFARTSRSNSRASSFSPEPTPRSSIVRSSFSESENSAKRIDNNNINTTNHVVRDNLKRTQTTVTVHLSKKDKNNSSPDLLDISHPSRNSFESSMINSNESLSRSMNNIRLSDQFQNARTKSNRQTTTKTMSTCSSKSDLDEDIELNSLQVFRQPKYKNRNKSLRKIKQLEHLNLNKNCKELVNQLGQKVQPNVYENQNSLNLVEFINKEGFITSTRVNTPVSSKRFPKQQSNHHSIISQNDSDSNDHSYLEVEEQRQNISVSRPLTPTFQKRVSFSTFHEPIQESLSSHNKKILPGTFWGIVQVTQPLRSRTDDERRRIAKLCYHAILTGFNNYSQA